MEKCRQWIRDVSECCCVWTVGARPVGVQEKPVLEGPQGFKAKLPALLTWFFLLF